MAEKAEQIAKIADYALMKAGVGTTAEILRTNIGDDTIRVTDLPRLKMPAQGGTSWTLPTIRGEETLSNLTGVILSHRKVRLYWREEGALGNPPDCVAEDGRCGVGDPGGICASCPHDAWGSTDKTNSRAKGCKEVKQLLFLRPTVMIPEVISLPPTSLRSFGQYMLGLSAERLPFFGVVTEVTLSKEVSSRNEPYSTATFRMIEEIGEAERTQFQELAALMEGLQGGVDTEDYTPAGPEPAPAEDAEA